ncbi:MAG: uroporphyrinogen-III C-methyltransferase [Tannerellaceae bacterium]|nr:uroporphyrinogen-III C-methyltransferase [Tannerellaceae bacterium]
MKPEQIHIISRNTRSLLGLVKQLLETLPEGVLPAFRLSGISGKTFGSNGPDRVGSLHTALLTGIADIAIYPAKELPSPLPAGLAIAAISQPVNAPVATSHPLGGRLAVVVRRHDLWAVEAFAPADSRRRYGWVTLVGFGPGDPDLLTIGGLKALEQADIIFHDDLLDQQFLRSFGKETIYVGKRKGKHHAEQQDINRMLADAARNGKQVVRLKGGDPMIFAHGGEEVLYLKNCFVPVKVIPGVTTACALAAVTQTSLTYRGVSSSVAFVLGHGNKVRTPDADTLVYYMGAGNIRKIAGSLIGSGRPPETPALLVYNVSKPDQQEFFSTLEELKNSKRTYPTPLIILVGEVVNNSTSQEKNIAYSELLTNLTNYETIQTL